MEYGVVSFIGAELDLIVGAEHGRLPVILCSADRQKSKI